MAITVKSIVLALAVIQWMTQVSSAACGDSPLPFTTCERNYEKVGGFIEKDNRVLPELLLNDRDCSSDKNDGHLLDWNKFTDSIHSLACRCAKKAKDKGYKVFGLQFYGECWSGPSAEGTFAKYGKADPSKSFQLIGNPPPPCDKKNGQECIGGPLINYVYKLKDDQHSSDVDGGYSKWSDWTTCSKTCGGGVKGRERTCTNPKPDGNGKDCSSLGLPEETAACSEQACPDPDVDGKWSLWQAWSSCSATCGGGVRVRQRTCDNPAPSGRGKKCEGTVEESGACAQDPCPIPCTKALDIGIILDGSGSVGRHNFKIALSFIEELISHFKVSADGTHFGFITYNGSPRLQFTMKDAHYHNFGDLKARVDRITYTGGWTRTDKALVMADKSLFTAAGGDRSGIPNILIVFTDGKTNRGSTPYPEVLRSLQVKRVRTVAVGIGRGINNDELREIAMDDQHYVVQVRRFQDLRNKLNIILDDSCQGIQPPTPEPKCTDEGVALGMKDRRIHAAQLSASSVWDIYHGTDRGRLNVDAYGKKKGAWSARYSDQGQYFQVDFKKAVKISQILTQGRQDHDQWVTSYWVSYSQDNGVYIPLVYEKDKGKVIFVGNNNRNTIKTNKLRVPIFARYLRVHPWSWHGHVSMRFEFYGCTKGFNPPVVPECLAALGLQSGAIADSKITASSQWDHNHRAANGRLYFQKSGSRRGAWSSRSKNSHQWLQVDLGKMTKVRMVGTQGRSDASQWVVNYWVSYSRDGVFWDKTDIMIGNSDRYTVVRNRIDPPIYGRYVRIHPKQYHSHMSMRAEFYGCTSGFTVPIIPCIGALGMQDQSILDGHITASSMWDANHSPARARLWTSRSGGKTGAWSAKTNDKGQWIQADLGKVAKITRVAIQGRQDHNQWVKSYSLQYSQDGGQFVEYQAGKILPGNSDRNTLKGIVLDHPIIARFIRFLPKTWHGHISMRFELYGCRSGFPLPPPPACLKVLGVESGKITDAQMSASSEWSSNHGANNGRLHHQRKGSRKGAWSALRNNRHQWLGVDFGKVAKVTMFATQGRQDYKQWVKTYKLEYSLDGYEYKTYAIKGQPKIFGGNRDQFTVVTHRLVYMIYARYVRVVPLTWYSHISMRVEFYGCNEGFVPPPVPACRGPLGLQNHLVKDNQISASSVWNSAHGAANARLYFHRGRGKTGGWSARFNNPNQWLMVDFKKVVKIVGLGTQGREDANQWVTKYELSSSRDGIFWKDYVKLFDGNSNRYTVVRHMLEEPIVARFVRIRPKKWHRHLSLRAEFYGCTKGFSIPPTICTSALGMKSRTIPDSRITSSSDWDSNHSSARARLDTVRSGKKTGAWSAKANDNGQWIQVDLGKAYKVTGIVTQGRQDYSQWVKKYTLRYSTNGVKFSNYGSLSGNSDRTTKVGHILKPSIIARYIRIHPTKWHSHISMRFEVYGCLTGVVQPTVPICLRPLAMTDSQMSASSIWHHSHRAANGRLHFHAGGGRTGAWSARRNDKDQWLQVNFGKNTEVRRIDTQGRQDSPQWVKTYTVSYSYDGIFWTDYAVRGSVVVFKGNTDRYTVVGHDFNPPISARYIRVNPQSWKRHISMRLQYYGCKKASQGSHEKCASPLGPQSKANPGSTFSASSMWDNNHSPSRAKLRTTRVGKKTGAWSSKYNQQGQWLQMSFGKVVKVTRLASQGRDDHSQWVKSFKIQYTLGDHFQDYNKGHVYSANNDRRTIEGHVLEPPIIAKAIRVLPMTWYGHISMRMELYGCTSGFVKPTSPPCESEFSLKDSQLSASTEWNKNHGASNARLHHQAGGGKTGAWSARSNDQNQWLQVDLGKVSKITRVSTRGRSEYNQWVKSYTIDYSVHGIVFEHYKEGGNTKVFVGNADRYTIVSHKLAAPIIARYVQFRPRSWYGHISMTVGLYGCFQGFSIPPLKCAAALGMQSKAIPDSNISASSVWDGNHGVARARLNTVRQGRKTGAWSARQNNLGQWLQVDFRKIVKITHIVTQGRQDHNQWVKSYKLQFSLDGGHFEDYEGGKAIMGNHDRNSLEGHVLVKPIITRFLRLRPLSWYGHISMRMELYGCTSGFAIPPNLVCGDPIRLGDWMMSASTQAGANHGPNNAKLGFTGGGGRKGAWASRKNDVHQWLQVSFDREMKITQIAMQGRHDYSQWVTSYSLEYSHNGVKFIPYKENGVLKVFLGNEDQYTIVSHKLATPIVALAVRFRPRTWHGHISLRVGVYGCPTGKKPASPPCHSPMDVGVILDRSGSIGSANFKLAQDFVMKMVRHLEYASALSRFGVIAYKSNANTIVKFSQSGVQNPLALEKEIYGIHYSGGGTRTDKALRLADKDLYSVSGGYRSNRPNVLFVLTDGRTNGGEPYSTVLAPLLRKKVKVIAVGVGSGINDRELLQIASGKREHVFHVKNFAFLFAKLDDILKQSCPSN